MKEKLFQKLSSRKFWALVAGLATSVMVLYNFGEQDIVKVTAVIGAFGSVAAYIFGEAYVDGKREQNKQDGE